MKMYLCVKTMVFFAFTFLFFTSCGNSAKDNSNGFENIISLKHTPVGEELMISSVSGLFMADSLLVVMNPSQGSGDNSLFTFIDPYKNKIVGKGGSMGRGNGEMLWVKNIAEVDDIRNTFAVFDDIDKSIVKYSYSYVQDSARLNFIKKLKIPQDTSIIYTGNIIKKGENYVALTLQGRDKFYTLLDSNMNFIKYFGTPPIKEEASDFYNRLQGMLFFTKNGFVYCPINLSILQYYTIKDRDVNLLWEDKFADTQYEVMGGSMVFNREKMIGRNLSIAQTNKYIFVLWWPGKLSDFGKGGGYDYSVCSGVVYVYTHKGDRVAKLNLDKNIIKFCADEKQNKLYGMTIDPEFRVVSFDLPKSF